MQLQNEQLKPQIGKYYLLGLSIIIISILIIYFCSLKVDTKQYVSYLLTLKASAMNDSLMKLKNANTISNLPEVSLITNNNDLSNLINCKNKITYLGSNTDNETMLKTYRNMCKTTCGGAGELLMVENKNDYVYNNKFVDPGVYCTVEPSPCNLNTGYVISSINSVVCRSKYPRLFGGPTASTIIACNDEMNPSTGSVLWDYANNEAVDTSKVLLTHEDETLPDGSYRFRCKYNETQNKNPYIPHPLDRFHPIPDKCNDSIYAASYSVHAVVTNTSWSCDCGEFADTRVKHLDENNPKSTCTSCYRETINSNTFKVPYVCFKDTAPYTMPRDFQPCLDYKGPGNLCYTTNFNIDTSNEDTLFFINTPMHNDMTSSDLSTHYRIYKNTL